MGIRVSIGGTNYEVSNYSVSEDATPTSSDDSTGSVGTLTFNVEGVPNPEMLRDQEVTLADTRKGSTLGFITDVQESDNGSATLTCQSRLGRLNIYDVQAQPVSGTLQSAFLYYASLASQVSDVFVDEQIANRPVNFQGWYGELWYNMKQLAAAQDCEIALVSDVILLRPLRTREAVEDRDVSRTRRYGGTTLARSVEVYTYDNHEIEDELVYPPGGWHSSVEVITVGAGETTEQVIELSASVSSIDPPVMQTFVSQDYRSSSVFTIVGDDGWPIQPAQWEAQGGSLTVTINDDTKSLTVRVVGPTNIASDEGEIISTYSVALGADTTGNRYSTLRIVGSGVAFNKEVLNIPTGVPDSITGTEVGITIDNPFLATRADAYQAGVKAARWYAGEKMTLSGGVLSVNQLGDSGQAQYPSYEFDASQWVGATYQENQDAHAGKTYQDVQDEYFDLVRNDFENQVFGNVGGVRIWDRRTHHWFRARSTNISAGEISYEAEDDLTYQDYQERYGHLTYEEEMSLFPGTTYSTRDRSGLKYQSVGPTPVGGVYPALDNFPSLGKFPSEGGSVPGGVPWPDTFYPDELYPEAP